VVHCIFTGAWESTVKPFYLAALKVMCTLEFLKVGDFMYKFILVPFILANSNNTILRQHTMPIKVGILSIFVPFNFMALFSSWNKEHANIKGFKVAGFDFALFFFQKLVDDVKIHQETRVIIQNNVEHVFTDHDVELLKGDTRGRHCEVWWCYRIRNFFGLL